MRSSRNPLLALAALTAPLGLCVVGLAVQLSGWPAHQAAREVGEAEERARVLEAAWERAVEEWRSLPALTVLHPGAAAPFARFADSEGPGEEDARGAILTELVVAGRYDAALAFHEAMGRDRPETPLMRWAVARALAGLDRREEARAVGRELLDADESAELAAARVDGLPLAGLVARWMVRWSVAASDREAAEAARDLIVHGLAPVPAFAAEELLAEWQRLGVAPHPLAGSSWEIAAAWMASHEEVPGAWSREGGALWVPRAEGALVVVPPSLWSAWLATLQRPGADGYFLESDEHPNRLATAELTGLARFAVRFRGTRDSELLSGLSWLLIGFGALGTLGGALLLWRVARREVALLRMRQAFVDQVSHDLRTPLTALMVKTELLASGQLPEHKVAGYQRSVHRETARLAEVVHSVLDFARLERAGVPIPLGPVPVREVLAEAFRGARELLEAQGCRVAVDVGRDLPPLAANRPLLVRALRNLLENAAHHAPGSEVSVAVRVLGETRLELVVADRGPGLGVRDPRVLFEAGRRGPVGEHGSGHGLGLSVVAQAVAAHGGEITACEREGGGALFRLVLPVEGEAA